MRKTKRFLIGSFGAAAALCLGLGFGVNAYAASANAIPEAVTGTATEAVTGKVEIGSFAIADGASVRMKAPNGIRFETSMQ